MTVDTRATAATTFKLSVSMATVGIVISFVGEDNAVVVVVLAALDMVKVGMELEVTNDDVVDVVSMELELDDSEDIDDKI